MRLKKSCFCKADGGDFERGFLPNKDWKLTGERTGKVVYAKVFYGDIFSNAIGIRD